MAHKVAVFMVFLSQKHPKNLWTTEEACTNDRLAQHHLLPQLVFGSPAERPGPAGAAAARGRWEVVLMRQPTSRCRLAKVLGVRRGLTSHQCCMPLCWTMICRRLPKAILCRQYHGIIECKPFSTPLDHDT